MFNHIKKAHFLSPYLSLFDKFYMEIFGASILFIAWKRLSALLLGFRKIMVPMWTLKDYKLTWIFVFLKFTNQKLY